MPECQNCGGWVSRDYARVCTPTEIDEPRCCPQCEDMIRNAKGVREKRQ